MGSGYDKKIIVFDKDPSNECPIDVPDAVHEIKHLVDNNNKCRVETYLVEATGLAKFLFKGGKKCTDYTLISGPSVPPADCTGRVRTNCGQLPTKREVQISEFWRGYYLPNCGVERSRDDHDVIVDWAPGFSLDHGLATRAYWNDNGFFIELTEVSYAHVVDWIWSNRKEKLESEYSECFVSQKNEYAKPRTITVKVFEMSISDLIEMDPLDKWNYGRKVYDQEHRFYQIAEEAIEDYDAWHKLST